MEFRYLVAPLPVRLLGFTSKTSEQVYIFIREYKIAYPTYWGLCNDCRTFVDALTKFLLQERKKIGPGNEAAGNRGADHAADGYR